MQSVSVGAVDKFWSRPYVRGGGEPLDKDGFLSRFLGVKLFGRFRSLYTKLIGTRTKSVTAMKQKRCNLCRTRKFTCMLCNADDIILVDETARGVNTKLEIWREALESKGFWKSRSKTEYMVCKFSDTSSAHEERLMIQDQKIPKSNHFRYLGSIISRDGEIVDDVTHRIQVGWLKWRSATSVLSDKRVPTKLKGKFYRTAIRPAMLYGTECWPIKKQHASKMSVAEMRMLRWMCGNTRRDKIRNETVREMVGVAPIEEKLRENRLRWFGHVYCRPEDAVVKRADMITLGSNVTGRGRPKLTLDAVVRKDMSIMGLCEQVALNRAQWRKWIHVADSK